MTTERDFAAWLDRGDADALARVFDATGGKLLLLAAHLAGAGGGAQAQDLLQATFVAAMAHGGSWDRDRPLWPWLAAILHNEARMAARRGRRRREVDLDAAAGAAAPANDPARLVASDEALALVLAAIDALPLPYRQVLRLRLVHGLRPVDIARSLEVPVGTVRAQLHRGLEQLRGALPAGVTAMVSVLLAGDEALLAQVRERVLEHALGEAAVVTGALRAARAVAASGWWAMNGKVVGVVVAGCVVLCCLAFATGVPGWFGGRPAVPAPAAMQHAELATTAAASRGVEAAPPERDLASVESVPAWPLTVTVRTAKGEPIAGAAVEAWIAPRGLMIDNQQQGTFGREDVANGVTGRDGVFRASLDALRERSEIARRSRFLYVAARSARGAVEQALFELPTAGQPGVEAELELRPEVAVVGRVVDCAGQPVSGAHVRLARNGDLDPAGWRCTDAHGAFVHELSSEQWPTHVVLSDGRGGVAATAVPAPPAPEDAPIDLGTVVLDPGPVLQGRAVLADGSPLAHLSVHLTAIDVTDPIDVQQVRAALDTPDARLGPLVWNGVLPVHRYARTNVGADGAFRFTGLDPDATYAVWIARADHTRTIRVGRAGDTVDLRVDGQRIVVEPRDERDELLPGLRVLAEAYDPTRTNPAHEQRAGFPEQGMILSNPPFAADPDGRLLLLSPHGWIWRIATNDDAAQPVAVRHDAVPGVYHATCVLPSRAQQSVGRLHVAAVDEAGSPVAFGVLLKSLDTDVRHDHRRAVMPPEGWTWALPAGRWCVEAVLGEEVLYLHGDGGFARGQQEHVVTIERGRTTELKLVAPPAGLVAFQLDGARLGDRWRSLRVEHAGREIATVLHEPQGAGRPASHGSGWTSFVGKQAFPPGRHVFLLQADGCLAVACTADVVADRLTSVRVEMFAK